MSTEKVYIRFPNQKPDSKSKKIMTSFLKILHILFGLNLGFFANKSLKFQLLSYLFPIIHCIILGVVILLKIFNNGLQMSSWVFQYFFEYSILMFLLLLFKRGTTFMDLEEYLKEIDVKLQADCSHGHSEFKFMLMIFFMIIERVVVSSHFCLAVDESNCRYSIVDIYEFLVLSFCLNVALLCYMFVFYSLYLRLEKLSFMLETNNDIHYVQRQYKTIVDTAEKYKKAFEPLYILMLLSNVPQMMATIYITLQMMQKQTFAMALLTIGAKNIYVLEVLMFTIGPALVAGMLTTQAEKIKIILHDIRLGQDLHDSGFVPRFIRYVEARPCRFRVWQLIPLSADLLGMVLSFCVTYLIVIIQFTHLK